MSDESPIEHAPQTAGDRVCWLIRQYGSAGFFLYIVYGSATAYP